MSHEEKVARWIGSGIIGVVCSVSAGLFFGRCHRRTTADGAEIPLSTAAQPFTNFARKCVGLGGIS